MLEVKKVAPQDSTLKKYVKYFWYIDNDAPMTIEKLLIPVTNLDIIFRLSDPIIYELDSGTAIATGAHSLGVRTKAIDVKEDGVFKVAGVSFRNFLSLPFVKLPLKENANRLIAFDEEDLVARLQESGDPSKWIEMLEKHLLESADFSLGPSEEELALMREFKESSGSISAFCEESGVSSKRLERLFYKYAGLSPKQFTTVFRMQKINRALLANDFESLTELAHKFGYSDQSHMIKEFHKTYHFRPGKILNEKITLKSVIKR